MAEFMFQNVAYRATVYRTGDKTMWKFSEGVLHFCISEILTICFFRVEKVDFINFQKCKSPLENIQVSTSFIEWD